ncbi:MULTISPECIES: hypothetical protein [Rhodococcus]|jgi:uncharacterized membrane protein YfcA|uniref:Uncharacterized protein n=1 Tax=Rhodococcus opacus RKJ300 = JCM 13270 TaxID=1165867 RepID=I0WRI9_RHOOP|nr:MULTISPECIES: hypothetical protein [Rhodococcus]EID79005.1 hypothetical protein W59_15696 [Rhodococcus opacus RKJ300 = JCM 13270]QQZ19035.1 hypothetical protein GO592_36765 [Rhodococcus sp. 21391]
MTTWTLWLGALLVVGGSTAQIKHQTGAARALWVLAVLAFVATAVGAITASQLSLSLLLTLVGAITATCALVAVTKEPTKAPAARRGAE